MDKWFWIINVKTNEKLEATWDHKITAHDKPL